MGSLVEILGNGLVERYCDECQHFKGIQKGQCVELNRLMKKVGAPAVPTVYGKSRADKCKIFRPLEFVDYVERAVEAGEALEVA